MIVQDLCRIDQFQMIQEGRALDGTISKLFCCDLLSIAMSRMPGNAAWVTVMANINTLAVASLTDAACIILAEGAVLDEPALQKAETEGMTIFATSLPIFEAALLIYKQLDGQP